MEKQDSIKEKEESVEDFNDETTRSIASDKQETSNTLPLESENIETPEISFQNKTNSNDVVGGDKNKSKNRRRPLSVIESGEILTTENIMDFGYLQNPPTERASLISGNKGPPASVSTKHMSLRRSTRHKKRSSAIPINFMVLNDKLKRKSDQEPEFPTKKPLSSVSELKNLTISVKDTRDIKDGSSDTGNIVLVSKRQSGSRSATIKGGGNVHRNSPRATSTELKRIKRASAIIPMKRITSDIKTKHMSLSPSTFGSDFKNPFDSEVTENKVDVLDESGQNKSDIILLPKPAKDFIETSNIDLPDTYDEYLTLNRLNAYSTPNLTKGRNLIVVSEPTQQTDVEKNITGQSLVNDGFVSKTESVSKNIDFISPSEIKESATSNDRVKVLVRFIRSSDEYGYYGQIRRPFFINKLGNRLAIETKLNLFDEELEKGTMKTGFLGYNKEKQTVSENLVGLINGEDEDPFSFESWENLIEAHFFLKKEFIIARVLTVDDHYSKHYFSYYPAQYINKLLFREDYDEKRIYRMKTRNPLDSRVVVGNIDYFVIKPKECIKPLDYKKYKKRTDNFKRIEVVATPEFFWEDQIASAKLATKEVNEYNEILEERKRKQEKDFSQVEIKINNGTLHEKPSIKKGMAKKSKDVKGKSWLPGYRSSVTILGNGDEGDEVQPDSIVSFENESDQARIDFEGNNEEMEQGFDVVYGNKDNDESFREKRKSKKNAKRISRFLETGNIDLLKPIVEGNYENSGSEGVSSNGDVCDFDSTNEQNMSSGENGQIISQFDKETKKFGEETDTITENNIKRTKTLENLISDGKRKPKYGMKKYAENKENQQLKHRSKVYSPLDHTSLLEYLSEGITYEKVLLSLNTPAKNTKKKIHGLDQEPVVVDIEPPEVQLTMEKEDKDIFKSQKYSDYVSKNVVVYSAKYLCDDRELLSTPFLRSYFKENYIGDGDCVEIAISSSFGGKDIQAEYMFTLPHPRIPGARIGVLSKMKNVESKILELTKEKKDSDREKTGDGTKSDKESIASSVVKKVFGIKDGEIIMSKRMYYSIIAITGVMFLLLIGTILFFAFRLKS
ncbi:hypothetical protein BB559_004173 [Furculomyces boomerangus]|uniref:Uncharacterized protein n=1 Tax=Furculomyces boomerangus TaxID=61424 RepID=A0A2T9YGA2_9FUNG|nr:hypothetical protein BB559_004173 [Furculomyces boomerangus]